MAVSRSDLVARFDLMHDDELILCYRSGELTELATEVARAEVERRGLDPNGQEEPAGNGPDNVGHGDLLILVRYFTPTEGYLLKGCLDAEGVPSFVADGHLVQANQFLSVAVGGVRVMVPESHFDEAKAILRAFNAGEYALQDDDDLAHFDPVR